MTVLLDLAVVRHVVLILLEQDLCQQAGSGDTFIDGKQRQGSNQHTAHTLGSRGGVVLQTPLLADDLLDIQLAGLVLHDTCHFLADFLVKALVEIVGSEDYLFQYGQVFHHDTVLPVLPALLLGLDYFLNSLVMGICNLLCIFRQYTGKEVGIVGIDDRESFGLTPEELAVQPCDLSRQLLDACVERFYFLLVALGQCLDRGVKRLYSLHEYVSFFHYPYLLNIVQRYEKISRIKNILYYK